MVGPMLALAAGVIAMPFAAPAIAASLGSIVGQLTHAPLAAGAVSGALAPVAWLSAASWLAIGVAFVALRRLTAHAREDATWGCGYAAVTARMQYTSSSFGETLLQLLPRPLRPRIAIQRDAAVLPRPGELRSDRDDPFTRAAYEPLLDRLGRWFARLRWVQQGVTHLYVLYILVAVVGMLAAVTLHDWWPP